MQLSWLLLGAGTLLAGVLGQRLRNPNEGTRCDSDVLFLLDKTRSVVDEFPAMKEVLTELVDLMVLGSNKQAVGIVAFAGRYARPSIKNFGALRSTSQLVNYVQGLRAGSTTYYEPPLKAARDLILRRRRQRPVTVIMISDGAYNDRRGLPREMRDALVADIPGVTTYAMDVKLRNEGPGLREVAGSRANVMRPPNLVEQVRRIIGPRVQCLDPRTTTPRPTTTPIPVTGCEVDLVLIIDFSSSVSEIYEFYVESAVKLVRSLRVGPLYTRVSLITYSSAFMAQPIFHFNSFDNAEDVIRAIQLAPYLRGVTHTGAAIDKGAEEFQERYGARPDRARKICVLMTDGFSQKKNPADSAKELRKSGAELYVVATARAYEPYMEELGAIAADGQKLFVDDQVTELIRQKIGPLNARCRDPRRSPIRRRGRGGRI